MSAPRLEVAEARVSLERVLQDSGLSQSEEIALLTEMAANRAADAQRAPRGSK